MSKNAVEKTVSAIVPKYLTEFRCIGADCEDNCCTGWSVTLDKATYKKYQAIQAPALVQIVEHYLSRNKTSTASDVSYAQIALLPESNACPFLEEKLCAIQKSCGASYLSNTCTAYPRITFALAGQVEQVLKLSCPEAARKALLDPTAFDFVETPVSVRPDSIERFSAVPGLSLAMANEIRIFCIQLVRTQGLALWQRLAVLGVFCEALHGLLQAGEGEQAARLVSDFVALVESGQVVDALAELPENHEMQSQFFALIWQLRNHGAGSASQEDIQTRVADGLRPSAEVDEAAFEAVLAANYQQGLARLDTAMEAAPWLLEHFILNEIIEIFPFHRPSVLESYLQLIARFGLLRMMLAGVCNQPGAVPEPALLVKTVQAFCRRFEHDNEFNGLVNNLLVNYANGRLDNVVGFLRA